MSNNIRFGFCDVTYNGITYNNLADKAVFQAIPTYTKMFGGSPKKTYYLLEEYTVSLTLSLNFESYETLKLSFPAFKDYQNGMYDAPNKVNEEGTLLTIHPRSYGSNKNFDITMFLAIVDPEMGFNRTFDKSLDKINVRFLGQPSKKINEDNTYFFIGDAMKAGVI